MIGQTFGHYTVLEQLGAGAMGEIYKARHNRLNRFVAIKVLPEDRMSDPDRRRRLLQEAQAASALNHANIVGVYDILSLDGRDLLVMEFVSGKTLDRLIPPQGFNLQLALKYAIPIAGALAAAHAAGIVHRDLKPANVMIGDDQVVKLLDFGLAKLIGPAIHDDATSSLNSKTAEGMILGTVSYMSPEQADARPVDARSDIFSFGSVLYEMLTGRRTFESDSVLSTLMAVLRQEPKPLRAIAPDLPLEIETIVTRCLRKDPSARFQSSTELKTALENILARPGSAPNAAPDQPAPSIAVLPFANLSADEENEYFSDGLAEEITIALAKLPGLRVASRTSAFAFRGKEQDISEIGRALKVANVLEGSVRRAGKRVRVTAELTDVREGFHLWSERYDREMTDIFAIQDEISQAIVDVLKIKLALAAPQRRTRNALAFTLYLKGRHQNRKFSLEGNQKAREHFRQALDMDPSYALAHVGMAICDLTQGLFGWAPPKLVMENSRIALDKALQLDETMVDVYWARGALLALFEHDWENAEREFQRALELDPDMPQTHWAYGYYLLRPLGRLDEALEHVNRALDLDPLSLQYAVALGDLGQHRRQYGFAIEQFQKAIELDSGYAMAHWMLGSAYRLEGRFHEAVTETERAAELSGRVPWALGYLGAAYASAGRRREAFEVIKELQRRSMEAYVSPAAFAWIYTALDETDKAFQWFEIAIEAHDPVATWLPTDPVLDPLRADHRYQVLLQKMNLRCG